MTDTPAEQKPKRQYVKTGHFKRLRAVNARGINAINGQTYSGGQAKRWRAEMIAAKGGKACPLRLRREIDLAMFDLWLLLELAEYIAVDAKERGAVINIRRRVLPKIHSEYDLINNRFARRLEAIEAVKPLDLARRMMAEKQQATP